MPRKIFEVPLKMGTSWTEWLPPDTTFLCSAFVQGDGPMLYCSSTHVDRGPDLVPWEFFLVSSGGTLPDERVVFRVGAFQVSPQHRPWFVYAKRLEVSHVS